MPQKLPDKFYIKYLQDVVKIDIPALSKSNKEIIKSVIEKKLAVDPVSFGKPLQYSLKGHRSLRVGNYRVVYRINITNYEVIIVAIKHRKEVYKEIILI